MSRSNIISVATFSQSIISSPLFCLLDQSKDRSPIETGLHREGHLLATTQKPRNGLALDMAGSGSLKLCQQPLSLPQLPACSPLSWSHLEIGWYPTWWPGGC